MALTQTDVDNLKAALAAGVLTVETEDNGIRKRVTYPSIPDLLRAIAYAEEQVAAASGAGAVTVSYAQFSPD